MDSLESELERARDLSVSALADAIESIGFECTRCGACCRGEVGCGSGDPDPHTATVFPEEIRRLQATDDYDWRDVARPMPYGLEPMDEGEESDTGVRTGADAASDADARTDVDAPSDPDAATTDADGDREGTTFEWALQTDDCGDCRFYDEADGVGACTVHDDRPLICRTYPFSVALGGTSQPMGEAVDEAGMVRAHECEGLGRDIDRPEAEDLAAALKERAVRELEEAIAVRDRYEPVDRALGETVVYDSEGPKRPDGTPIGGASEDN